MVESTTHSNKSIGLCHPAQRFRAGCWPCKPLIMRTNVKRFTLEWPAQITSPYCSRIINYDFVSLTVQALSSLHEWWNSTLKEPSCANEENSVEISEKYTAHNYVNCYISSTYFSKEWDKLSQTSAIALGNVV